MDQTHHAERRHWPDGPQACREAGAAEGQHEQEACMTSGQEERSEDVRRVEHVLRVSYIRL